MQNKRTVLIGATSDTNRYANKAAVSLVAHGHELFPLGIREGSVAGIDIIHNKPIIPNIDTVTLYIGSKHQPEWYDYVLLLKPSRIIFNPGAENKEFEELAQKAGIETVNGCTLVMLSVNTY